MMRADGEAEFYSRFKQRDQVELFVDKYGNPTINYPHVHVVHHGDGEVNVVASVSKASKPWKTTLHDPSGN
jgi:hypothetical protein